MAGLLARQVLGGRADRRRLGDRGRGAGDCRGNVLRVVLDPAQERGAAGVLPGQAEEVETGHGGDAAAVLDAPVFGEDRRLNEGVSSAKPVAQITALGDSAEPSANRISVPDASTARPRSSMPCRRRAARGLEPMRVSRPCSR